MRLPLPLSLLLFVACAGPALPDPYVVRDLRIIAIVAEPPEAAPGQAVQLTAWFYDPDGGGREVYATIFKCREDGQADCLVRGEPVDLLFAEGPAERVATDLYRFTSEIVIPSDALANADPLAAIYGDQITYVARGDNGVRTIDGLKRVVVRSPRLPPNRNPAFQGFMIEQDGRDLGDDRAVTRLTRNARYLMRPLFDPAVLETYIVADFTGEILTFTEEASFTWSCSPDCGIDQRTTFMQDVVTIVPPRFGAESNRFAIHVVMRDGRGGESLLVRDFDLLPEVPQPEP